MPTISNDHLTVSIQEKGAELTSIYNKQTGLEYMWNADPAFWAKTSPILFPIVGTLKDDTYFYKGKSYSLSRHGFARDMNFTVSTLESDTITFTLVSNEATKTKYPFDFRFDIIYTVTDTTLAVTYKVINTGNGKMYFSVGGHPAFKVPLAEGTHYNDYYLNFNKEETAGRWPISKEGLIEKNSIPLLTDTNTLPLTKELFAKDALVFKSLNSTSVSLVSSATTHGFAFDYTGFPFLGIWAAKNADFICIEPWCGIADSVDADQELIHKEGINELEQGAIFKKEWKVRVW